MAEFSFKGLDEVRLSFTEVAQLPDELVDEILNAGADILVPAQRREAERLGKVGGYRNPKQKRDYSTGTTARSIKKGRVKVKDGWRVLYVTPIGSRTRGKKKPRATRNAEIAFVTEAGAPYRHNYARPFIAKANEASAAAVEKAEFDVYDKWLKSKNL